MNSSPASAAFQKYTINFAQVFISRAKTQKRKENFLTTKIAHNQQIWAIIKNLFIF